MPELPEVETVVRDLRPHLVGRRLARVRVSRKALRRKWSPAWSRQIQGRIVANIDRRGKWILLDLGAPWLVVHLGMTGQFTVVNARQRPQPHTHLIFTLDDGQVELRFRDIRRFGSVRLFQDRGLVEDFFIAGGLGPEPWQADAEYWRDCLKHTRRCLKAVLLDQRVIAGVGNIYADESLFEARLFPGLLGKELTPTKRETLRQAIVMVLERAIARRGSSIRDYVGGDGARGNYQDEFRVYGQTGQPCPRCRTPIQRIVLAGRSTHFCPRCQKRT